jgi:cysteine-rich repeat protein
MRTPRPSPAARLAGALALLLLGSGVASSAVIVVTPADGAGEGFNDPTPVAPVGGNPGTTRGQQRLNAFEYAADIWAATVASDVTIVVEAAFDPLLCGASFAVLGQAGPVSAFRDFAGAPLANTWYPVALANRFAGVDLDPGVPDIGATFNSTFGAGCAFPVGFYYGLDANPGGDTDFVSVVLHELGHGLGFLTFVDRNPNSPTFGGKFNGRDDTYMVHLEDHSSGLGWPAMTDAQRATSMTDTADLHWVGPTVVAAGGFLSAGRHASGHVQMYAPNPIEGGSSISHWDTALTPNQLMEPSYTGPIHDPSLSAALMADLGWGLIACGDGVIEVPETCDDGNAGAGDGCSAACQIEECYLCAGAPSVCMPAGDGASCNDGDACTQIDTCQSAICTGANPVVCTGDQCHDPGTCNPATGLCVDPPKPNGTPCSDGDACTGLDACNAGTCTGLPGCVGHFLCYKGKTTAGTPKFVPVLGVDLLDQFEPLDVDAKKLKHLCTPANKDGGGFVDAATHLASYQIKAIVGSPKHVPQQNLKITNVVGVIRVDTIKPDFLMVPTSKDLNVDPPLPGPNEVDHYKCYKIKVTPQTPKFPKGLTASLTDQFGVRSVSLLKPSHLCTPVEKNGEAIKHASVHQLCYKVKPAPATPKQPGLHLNNQFGILRVDTVKEDLLCAPSLKELP